MHVTCRVVEHYSQVFVRCSHCESCYACAHKLRTSLAANLQYFNSMISKIQSLNQIWFTTNIRSYSGSYSWNAMISELSNSVRERPFLKFINAYCCVCQPQSL